MHMTVTAKPSFARTALFEAVYLGCHAVARALLENAADVDRADASGVTPLRLAATRGCLEAVQRLGDRRTREDAAVLQEDGVEEHMFV